MTNPNNSDKERGRVARSSQENDQKLETEIRKIIDSLDDQARKASVNRWEGGSVGETRNDILVTEIRNKNDRYYSRTTVMSETEETTITEMSEGKTSELRITSGKIEQNDEQTSTPYPPNGSTGTTEPSNEEDRRLKNKRKRTICFCTGTNQQEASSKFPETKSSKKKRLDDSNNSITNTETTSSKDNKPPKHVAPPWLPPPQPCSCLHSRVNMSFAPTEPRHPEDCSCFKNDSMHRVFERIDGYDKNHISLTTKRDKATSSKFFRSWYDMIFNRNNDKPGSDDSGSTLPQLYKARMGHGATPEKFTFKAVIGNTVQSNREPSVYRPPPNTETKCGSCHPAMTRNCSHHVVTEPRCQQPSDQFECNRHHDRDNLRQPLLSEENEIGRNTVGEDYGRPRSTRTKAFFSGLGGGYVSSNAVPEKVDIYCFDQLNTGFFRTSDHPPPLLSDIAIQRTESQAARFWAEIFGFIHIILACVVAFVLQTFKFVLQAIVRPLLIGIVQIFADYFFKPLLTLVYNGITQPVSVFLFNVVSSLRDVLHPVAKTLGYFIDLVASILRSIRFVDIKQSSNIAPCKPV